MYNKNNKEINLEKYLCAVLIGAFLVGCTTSPTVKTSFEEIAKFYFKKAVLVKDLETRVILKSIYLNPIENCANTIKNCSNSSETFLMAIYIENDFQTPNESGLFNPFLTLTLNGQKAVKTKLLTKENPLIKQAPFFTQWDKYYLVSFPKNDAHILNLELGFKGVGYKTLSHKK